LVEIGQSGVSEKQLVGFLTLLEDVLKNLGSRLVFYWPALLGATINITATAHSRIEKAMASTHSVEVHTLEGEEDLEDELNRLDDIPVSGPSTFPLKVTRSIRQIGVKRFADFFRIPAVFDFTPYMPAAFESFITPRLSSFDKENTQAPSALLELFHSWTNDGIHLSFLVDSNHETLPKIFDCLVATNLKPSVISKIFDIIENIIHFSTEDEYVSGHVLKPFVSRLLSNLSSLMEKTKGSILPTTIGQRQIAILSEVSQYSKEPEQASTLLAMLIPLLRKPSKVVPDKVKVGLVKIVGDLIRLIPDLADRHSVTFQTTYRLLSHLFQALRSRPARINLVSTFGRLAQIVTPLSGMADLLESLNAYSVKRLDEPDFDRRLRAFGSLNETLHKTMLPSDWLPILFNMLYFIQDADELATRTNASFAMKHFIDQFATQSSPDYDQIFLTVLYPGLKNGLRTKNELVRAELLGVLAYSVEKCAHVATIKEMKVLLEGGDEEANFFNNVLHVQVHRRSRALRRLADHCDEGHIRGSTINEIFIPLVGNFVAAGTVEHHLVDVAIMTTGRMAKRLSWSAYYTLVRKYLSLSESKDGSERVYVRTLVSLLENFPFPMEQVESKNETLEIVDDEDELSEDPPEPASTAISDQPATVSRIGDAVNLRLLPKLLHFLENYDPNTENQTRILIAAGIVAVAKHLPTAARDAQITRLLTILSQILRSKSQDMRDLVRDSLNRIFVRLGPAYLPILFRELRASLTRGPQLHVLAHVTHSVISHVTSGEHASSFSTLDDCVNDVGHIAAEVVFGESGKDLQAEDFKSKMREVRGSSSRGLDSFSIIAKHISPSKISSLLAPVKAVMHETSSMKVMGLVDEVLKRITVGLNGNHHLVATELLTLCNTLISQNAKFLQQTPLRRKNSVKSDVIVQVNRQVTIQSDHYADNSHRYVTIPSQSKFSYSVSRSFVVFGLNLLHIALKRNRFDFQDSVVLAKLEAMVVVVGNTLYSKNASVLTLGIRSAAGLCKCPLKGIQKSIPVIVRQILDILKQIGTTESDLSQTALTSLATILREGPPVQVKEKDLDYLLGLVSPDLEEQSRQTAAFALLRAIVARKFVVPEIYDLMEKVSEISVTSQSPQVQELCRGVLLQFLLDYPQGKGRLRNQMTFFAKNLSYVHESGRTSVMELLNAVILKFQAALIEEYAEFLFVALVMVIANDESAKCREMAAQLIKDLWTRSDEERKRILLSHIHNWASQTTRELLTCVATQVYGLILDVARSELSTHVADILDDLNNSVQRGANEGGESTVDIEHTWQLPYHSLTVLSKVLSVFPSIANQHDKIAWKHITELLLFPHSWVRIAACRLLGLLFNSTPVASPRTDLPADSPLSSFGMREVAKKLTQQLKGEHLNETLSVQVVKNLFYVGKCFCLDTH
jgi:U3 small nucleolar RNA-associated protein 20